jgi:hypothetical protein
LPRTYGKVRSPVEAPSSRDGGERRYGDDATASRRLRIACESLGGLALSRAAR